MCSVAIGIYSAISVYKTVYELVTVKMMLCICMSIVCVMCSVCCLDMCSVIRVTNTTTRTHSVRIMFVRILFVCIYVAHSILCDVI